MPERRAPQFAEAETLLAALAPTGVGTRYTERAVPQFPGVEIVAHFHDTRRAGGPPPRRIPA